MAIILQDTFNKSDNPTSLGQTDTGIAWQPLVGTWGIISNNAYNSSNTIKGVAVVNAGVSDCKIIVTLGDVHTTSRIVFRAKNDGTSYYSFSNGALSKYENGNFTSFSGSTSTYTKGDIVTIELNASSIKIWRNGNSVIQINDGLNTTSTLHGIGSDSSVAYFDNYLIKTLAPDEVTNLRETHTTNYVDLSWTNPVDTSYQKTKIYRGGSFLNETTQQTFRDQNLTVNTTYTYTIRTLSTSNAESTGVSITAITDVTPPSNVTGLMESHTDVTATLNWTNPADTDFHHVKVYKNNTLIADNIIGTNFNDTGLTPSTLYQYKVTSVDNAKNESSGTSISVNTNASYPVVSIVSVSHYKISGQTGINQCHITFTFNTDITQWSVNVMGVDYATGTVADSGGAITAGIQITAIVDNLELYQEGDNRINIYGRNIAGWTPYNS